MRILSFFMILLPVTTADIVFIIYFFYENFKTGRETRLLDRNKTTQKIDSEVIR